MITSLEQLRAIAVKHIIRRGPADYLLRHSLCKRWVASEYLDEMAWTDYTNLYFNFPKLRAQLDSWGMGTVNVNGVNVTTPTGTVKPLDPGDHTVAFLAAAAHEMMHVLYLHGLRGKGKEHWAWQAACEYAINVQLGQIFGLDWIQHLQVMYPSAFMFEWLDGRGLNYSTDNFYDMLLEEDAFKQKVQTVTVVCHFCDRADQGNGCTPSEEEAPRMLYALPDDSPEREGIMKFLAARETVVQKLPWEMLLMGGIEDAVQMEQTWAVPSRRNELLPGWRHEKLLSFVWVLDVSPSIDEEMKQSFMNTLQAGISLYHDSLHRVIFFAQGIEGDIVISSGTNLTGMDIPSGGGTDLTDVWAILERDLPEYVLVLSDLELMRPVPKPSYTQVVWGIIGDYWNFEPDYGTKIFLD